MSKKISKKFLIVLSALVAVVLLTTWVIVSGTAEKIHFYFVMMNTHVGPDEDTLLDDLKPGKYLLQREWGLDETEYIEITDCQTARFVGEYWENQDAKSRARAEIYDTFEGPYYSEWNVYKLHEHTPFVFLAGTPSGFSYADENTLEATRTRDEVNDVTDFNHEPNDPDTPRYHNGYVIAHYIYTEQ